MDQLWAIMSADGSVQCWEMCWRIRVPANEQVRFALFYSKLNLEHAKLDTACTEELEPPPCTS